MYTDDCNGAGWPRLHPRSQRGTNQISQTGKEHTDAIQEKSDGSGDHEKYLG